MVLHERWFVANPNQPLDTAAVLSAQTFVPLLVAVAITAGALFLWRKSGHMSVVPGPVQLGISPAGYQNLLSWMPLIIGLHAAVLLLVSGISRQLFVPNLALPRNIVGAALGLAQIAVALSFFYGALTRIGAPVLALTWLSGAMLFHPLLLLEHAFLLGIAFFLFSAGRGPFSLDMVLRGTREDYRPLLPHSVTVLRVTAGLSIATLAFTEKLWNVPLGLAFLEQHPFNFLPALGFDVSNAQFIILAGAVELTLGLLLISGAFIRVVILLLWLPFNLTLPMLGWRELVGHLPMYGIMALLLIWGEERREKEQALASGLQSHAVSETRSRTQ